MILKRKEESGRQRLSTTITGAAKNYEQTRPTWRCHSIKGRLLLSWDNCNQRTTNGQHLAWAQVKGVTWHDKGLFVSRQDPVSEWGPTQIPWVKQGSDTCVQGILLRSMRTKWDYGRAQQGVPESPPTLGKWAVATIICKTIGEIKYSSRGYLKGFPGGSDGKESACDVGDPVSTAGSGRPPGEGNDNPLQYPCLENPMDRGAWWATVHGVTRSQTSLSN